MKNWILTIMLITIPALAFFMAVQRHLVAGWGTGGLKG